jgi:hypothetical protein
VKRRQPAVDLDGAALPDRLRTFTAADWPGSTTLQRAEAADLAAGSSGVTADAALAIVDRHHRRRQWESARLAWCAEHDLTDERGRIDWHRFRALLT